MGRKTQKRDLASESAAGFSSSFGDLLKQAMPEAALPQTGDQGTPAQSGPAQTGAAPTAGDSYTLKGVGLVLRRERKGRGGKTVTRLTGRGDGGLPMSEGGMKILAKDMKKSLGCGATVEPVDDGADVILQGDLVDRAAQWLEGKGAKVAKG